MFTTIVIASIVLMALSSVVFLLARYLPIIANLIMNVTIRRVAGEHVPLAGETVTFETADGVRLVGTLTAPVSGRPDAPIVVFCHEYTSDRHSATKYGWFLQEDGFRVFAFDFRGHGDSDCPANYIPRQWVTEHEICDVRSALRFLQGRSDCVGTGASVALFGVSRGAVAALIAAADEPTVSAVVSDSAFCFAKTLHGYMRRWAPIFVDPRMLVLSAPDRIFSVFRWLATRLAEHRVGVRFLPLVPTLRRLDRPVFFLHGEDDHYIEHSQAQMLQRCVVTAEPCWIVPQADHNRAVDVAPMAYRRRVVQFLRTSLGVTETVAPSGTSRPVGTRGTTGV